MTTVFYKPGRFAACDSKWSINGYEINDIRENKYILHVAPKSGEMLVTLMAGSHVAIVLNQALLTGLITPGQFFNLFQMYDEYFDLDYDFVTFVLANGVLRSKPHSYYPNHKRNGIYSFGSGGIFAGSFFYHAAIFSHKKRKKVPVRNFSHACGIICAMNYAYSQDVCSGGKVHKVEWLNTGAVHGTMISTNKNYSNNLTLTLMETMREIHDMYTEKAQNQVVASLAEKKRTLYKKQLSGQAIAKTQSNTQATKMTVSTVIDHLKWFESL